MLSPLIAKTVIVKLSEEVVTLEVQLVWTSIYAVASGKSLDQRVTFEVFLRETELCCGKHSDQHCHAQLEHIQMR